VWRWVVVSEAFTERAFPTFMQDAIVLLCGYFRYVPPAEVAAAGTHGSGGGGAGSAAASAAGVPAGAHGWDVEHSLSDKRLTRMLGALKPSTATRSSVGTTGKLADTGALRTNQDGALDEAEDSPCPACAVQ
jgi:hypothetical protein